jgi:hypothetical protein
MCVLMGILLLQMGYVSDLYNFVIIMTLV